MTVHTALPIGRDRDWHARQVRKLDNLEVRYSRKGAHHLKRPLYDLFSFFVLLINALSDKCRKTSYKHVHGFGRMNNARLPFEQSGEELKLQRGEN